MDRRNFSLLAVTGFLGLAAAKTSQASTKEIGHPSGRKLAGVFRTTGTGSSLGGPHFNNEGVLTNLGTNTRSGAGTLTFKNNGTGKGTTHGIAIVQDNEGGKYIEEVSSHYNFTFTLDKTRKVSIFITAGSWWKGQFSQGPRKGLNYEKLILNNDLPYFEGYVSRDGERIELSTSIMMVIRTLDSDGGICESVSSQSVTCIK